MTMHMTGPDLAIYLAKTLTDLEFELLIRERIKQQFDLTFRQQSNLDTCHNECTFIFSWVDKSTWRVELGSTYADEVTMKGEVLSTTVVNALNQWNMQNGNKLSLLLPAPTPEPPQDEIGFDATDDKRW